MTSSKQKAYDCIKSMIVSCQIKPGEAISEAELIKQLEIGRTPIREALLLLESEDYVKIFPKRGIFVNEISVQDINDTFGMLFILEPIAAVAAVKNIEKEKLLYFLKIFEDPDTSYYQQNYLEVDRNFHSTINSSTGNKIMYDTLMSLYDHNTRVRLSKYVNQSRMFATRGEHAEILRAMLEEDEEKVRELMIRHITNGRKAALS